MGIINSIKQGISNAASWVKITLAIKTKYLPYFSKKEKFQELKIIDSPIDEEITQIYVELKRKNPTKYANEIMLYEKYLKDAKYHNQTVIAILNEIKRFHYDEFLNNPSLYSTFQIDNLFKIAQMIPRYQYKEKAAEDFYKHITDIKKDYLLILEQYKLKKQLDQAIESLNGNTYVSKMLIEKIKQPILQLINSNTTLYYDFSLVKQIPQFVQRNNQEYMDCHLGEVEPLDDRVLDNDQKEAILKDEKSLLVIAGAGSGKTLTLIGKVKYLLEVKNVDPKDILILSYSKPTVEDLKKKFKNISSEVCIKTFHSLGYEILAHLENKKLMVEDQLNSIVESYFRDELKKDKKALSNIVNYFAFYSSPYHTKVYQNKGEMYEEIKSARYETMKSLVFLSEHPEKRETLKKEIVKSNQEMAIANFYFIHGIDYCYEDPYQNDYSSESRRQYMPDFHLTQYDIYHEHYGLDKNGKASQYQDSEAEEYLEAIEWKRRKHEENQTICIETYSYEFDNDIVFKKLEKELRKHGVEIKEVDEKRIYEALNSIYGEINFRSFIKLVISFLNLYKSKYQNDKGFDSLMEQIFNNRYKNRYTKKRTILFLNIVKKIYHFYMSKLEEKGKIDFDTMILESTKQLPNVDGYEYKYILVDEFQDMTTSRMKFLRALIEKGKAHLFAVGDDWQSIYRFNGSDISIFTDFQQHFEYAELSYIRQTHRNSQELQDIAGAFIKKNKGQSQKTIMSKQSVKNPIKIMFYDNNKEEKLLEILQCIHSKDENARILILGRNNNDILCFKKIIKIDSGFKEEENHCYSYHYPSLKIKFSTVHGAKGLEEDYVALINADDGLLGFPNRIEDDEILKLILPMSDQYEYSEERRLWYVALTRAKKYVYILANRKHPSPFVIEIKPSCEILDENYRTEISDVIHCPWCKKGELVFRSKGKFFGCSNYPYCRYRVDYKTIKEGKICPKCGDYLVRRQSRYNGFFYGCNNYPRCNYTKDIRKRKKY